MVGNNEVDSALKQLDILVGTWKLSGETQGQIRYEWLDGGFFLIQNVELEHEGNKNTGIEVIGRERGFGAPEPSKEIKVAFLQQHRRNPGLCVRTPWQHPYYLGRLCRFARLLQGDV
jgi:hypothetical protein